MLLYSTLASRSSAMNPYGFISLYVDSSDILVLDLSRVERLQLKGGTTWMRDLTTSWLGSLRAFTAVQTLHLSRDDLVPRVAHTLGNLGGQRAAEVVPALHTILL
jgi:hypothetical protein